MPISSPWASALQPGSFNQIPFVTEGTTYTTGRRVAVHSYPFRDNPWIEDLGLATRNIQFTGFLVGNDVYTQRDALKKACETGGNGTLVHPSMGTITAALVTAAFGESVDKGRTVQVQFQFVVSDDKPRYPAATVNTQGQTASAATAVNSASSGDFFSQVGSAIKQGTTAVSGVLQSAQGFLGQVNGIVRDASGIVGSVTGGLGLGGFGIGGVLGRFSSGLGAVNGVLGGLNNISTNLGNLGGFISNGMGGVVQGGINGLAQLSLPATTVIGSNLGTLGSLQGVANVINSNTSNFTNFINANTSPFSGISQGIGQLQQMTQQIGSVINQTTAIRGLVTNAANQTISAVQQL